MVRRLSTLLVALALLAACGPAPAAQPSAAPAQPTQPAAPAAAADSPFPVTIAHKYGDTTIPAAPQRVVALGYTDQDPILALGVTPVATRYYFGDAADAVWPWAEGALGGAAPQVLNMPFGELNVEAIAALQPDLIVAVSAGITDAEYATLSQIAPTLAQSAEYVDFGVPWQEQTRVIGRALGAAERAEELVSATEARFAELRAAHPEFAGATAVIAAPAADGQFFFSGPEHERQRVLASLGFALPDELAALAGDSFYGTVSAERLDLLDADVLIVTAGPAEQATVAANPLFQQLDAVKAGRVISLDTTGGSADQIGPALVYSSVLSLPLVFDELVPQLAAALDGAAAPAPADGATRLVRHAMGETLVPASPQRVVVLDSGELDAALTLGVKPVGAFTLFEGDDFLGYLRDGLEGVQPVGTIGEPNLEAIAALQPDLILSNKVRHEAIYPQLSAIAPTVFAENIGAVWKENFRLYAEALGKHAEGESVVARYERRLADFRERMGERLATQVSVIRVVDDGVRIMQRRMYIGVILADAGLARPPAQDVDDRFQLVSFEQIPEMDGDVIFVSAYGKNDDALASLLASPLWQANRAAQQGQVQQVNDDVWHTGLGFTAANLVIDDLERTLLGAE